MCWPLAGFPRQHIFGTFSGTRAYIDFSQHATSKKNAPGTSVARATSWKARSVRPRSRTSTRSYQLREYYDWVLKTLADEFFGHYTWTRSGDVKVIGRLETLLDEVDLGT